MPGMLPSSSDLWPRGVDDPFWDGPVKSFGWHRVNKASLQYFGLMSRRDRMPMPHLTDAEYAELCSGICIESASMTGRNTASSPLQIGINAARGENLLPLADVPLAAWSVMAAVKCEGIDRIILSTDDDDYFETVMKAVELHGPVSKEVVFDRRSDKDAGAKVKIFDYIKHGLSKSPSAMTTRLFSFCRQVPSDVLRAFRVL